MEVAVCDKQMAAINSRGTIAKRDDRREARLKPPNFDGCWVGRTSTNAARGS